MYHQGIQRTPIRDRSWPGRDDMNRCRRMLSAMAIYYLKASVFTLLAYGLLRALHGETGISFTEWAIIMFAAFTIGYLPTLFKTLRAK